MFWGFSNSTGESILNGLEAVYLGDVYVDLSRGSVIPFPSVDYPSLLWITLPFCE